jgi:hypothetical protein
MAALSETYSKLFSNYRKVEQRMSEGFADLQEDLLTAARAIVRFEIEHALPKLKELVSAHGSAVANIEAARAKLNRLERSIANQELYVSQRFAEHDVVGATLDLLAWKESARFGAEAVKSLIAEGAGLESELRAFIKERKGISDCLTVEQQLGWDQTTRESFSWLFREVAQAEAQRKAA